MPNVTNEQIAVLLKSAGKLEDIPPAIEKKFPAIKQLLDDIHDMDPSRTSVDDFTKQLKKCSELIKDVEKAKAAYKPVIVKAYTAARNELIGKDAKVCQALAAVVRGDKGRTGPKEKDVEQYNHIHIGGNANDNLLFKVQSRVVLGRLKFHLEKGLNDGKKKQIKNVAGRSGATIELTAVDGEVTEE